MIDPATERVIAGIHGSGRKLVLEFTGAGSLGLAWLHGVGGSSRTILQATDRYSPQSLKELLGRDPEKFVSPDMAAAMAGRAYVRAHRLADDHSPCLGLGCTAAIATDRAKRGEHRVCVAVQDGERVTNYDLTLIKGRRDRQGEEAIVARVLVMAIAKAAGVEGDVPLATTAEERVVETVAPAPDPLLSLGSGAVRSVMCHVNGPRVADEPITGIVYSGSFNPLHFGHEALAHAAARVMGLPFVFELPAVNADKAAIGRTEIERRLEQFHGRSPVVVTRAPLFRDKARLFPGCTFVVGYDTAARMIDPRFYGGSESERDESFAELRAANCRVLVAGRAEGEGFKTLNDLAPPGAAHGIFIELPPAEFRADVSGTALRARRSL